MAPLAPLEHIPSAAVSMFIVISGFVIAHLLLVQQERYGPYIFRRFMRIFPVFAICALLGLATNWLSIDALRNGVSLFDPQSEFARETVATVQSMVAHPIAHSLAHVTLIHGAIPDTWLPFSERVFLPPGWSLSLEWQFYLIAPFWLALLLSPRWRWLGIALPVAGVIFYQIWLDPHYRIPTFLPGKGIHFLVGILSRIYLDRIDAFRFANMRALIPVLIVAVLAVTLSPSFVILVAWILFIRLATTDHEATGIAGSIRTLFNAVFNSRLAQYLGSRSYPLYAVHWPVMEGVGYTLRGLRGSLVIDGLFFVLSMAAAVLMAEILHRLIEKPSIRLSKRLVRPTPKAASAPV